MRNISFHLTQKQMRDRTKTVTRRLNWSNVKIGETLMACVKCQGIPKGGSIEHIHAIRVLDVRLEPLNAITAEDCALEGFPEMSPQEFVQMFCSHMGCQPTDEVKRIQFEHL